jgi:hypothetical protein
MALELVPAAAPAQDVALYVAQASPGAEVVLDDEHDRYLWLPLEEAVLRCLPREVGAGLTRASGWLDARSGTA